MGPQNVIFTTLVCKAHNMAFKHHNSVQFKVFKYFKVQTETHYLHALDIEMKYNCILNFVKYEVYLVCGRRISLWD